MEVMVVMAAELYVSVSCLFWRTVTNYSRGTLIFVKQMIADKSELFCRRL